MKIKSMTDDEIGSFNLTVHTLRENLRSLREAYNAVEEGLDELKAVVDAVEVDDDEQDLNENFDVVSSAWVARYSIANPLADLEEMIIDELDLLEKDEEDDDDE